ncbi:hypothetical protein, partial [Bradyrhizobium sp.]|uniref:hypothetical protein n=1 Tax=Bradyrhizobium sp. TaxID=376 RepID=UPI0039191D3C
GRLVLWHRSSRAVNLESRLQPFFFFCGCCGHVDNAIALSKRSGMSTALRSFGRIAEFGAGSHR